MLKALAAAEYLLGLHEGSAKPEPKPEGGFTHPVVWISGEDFDAILNSVRLSLQAAEILVGALKEVTAATADYLPPDGISIDEAMNHILAATDNERVAPLLSDEPTGNAHVLKKDEQARRQ